MYYWCVLMGIYLDKRVKDVRKKGLDTLTEVENICREIIKDYKAKRISYRTAIARMNLLDLVITRNSKLQGKKRKAHKIVDTYRQKLMMRKS